MSLPKLLASLLATFGNAIALLFCIGLCVLTGYLGVGVGVGVTSIMSFIGIMLSLAAIVWARFDREFGFTAAISPDGVRIRRGLTARRHDDPPGRIHALRLTQPLIWRIFDWYRVDITQAGNAVSSANEKTEGLQADVASDVLLPVGSRAEAAQAIAMVVPSLGVNDPDAFLESLCAGGGATAR